MRPAPAVDYPKAQLIVIEPKLVNATGHFLNNTLGYERAAAELGLRATIYVPRIAEAAIVELLDARPVLPPDDRKRGDAEDLLDLMADAAEGLRPSWLEL